MAITVNTTDTFEQWRVKTNQLGSDVDSNIAAVRSDITSNVVTIAGNVTAILANIASLTGNIITGNLTIGQQVLGDVVEVANTNVFIGKNAGVAHQTAANAVYMGFNAGYSSTTAQEQVFIGACAGYCNQTGTRNTFVGTRAGFCSLRSNSSFLGYEAGYCNTTGDANTFMGTFAGRNNTTGGLNTFAGACAGALISTGQRNAFFGHNAGNGVTTGCNNTIIGSIAGTSGLTNTIILAAGTCEWVRVNNAGQMSIDSTDPGFAKLFVNAKSTDEAIKIDSTNAPFISWYRCGVETAYIQSGTTGLGIERADAQPITIGINGSEVARFTESGKVGINTSSPLANLHVQGPNADDSDAEFVIGGKGQLAFHNSLSIGSFNPMTQAGDKGIFFHDGSSNTGNLIIGQWSSFSRGIRIDNGGNVQVGTRLTMGGACDNLAFGRLSGDVSCGTDNFFAGCCAGFSNTSGSSNNFFGNSAGTFNTTGSNNFFAGRFAGYSNNTGNSNFFAGVCAGYCNTGSGSIFIGANAGCQYNSFGGVFIGCQAGMLAVVATGSTFIGMGAGQGGGCAENTAVGYLAGLGLSCGSFNTFLGSRTGRNAFLSGCCNTFLGACAGHLACSGSNNILVGFCAGLQGCIITNDSNHIIIGNTSHTNALVTPSWATLSDVRDKQVIGPVPLGKTFLKQVQTIEYRFKDRETNELKDEPTKRRYGFSAQQIEQLEGENPVIVSNKNPDLLYITHDYLIPVLVNAVKELSDEIDELRAEIQQLKSA